MKNYLDLAQKDYSIAAKSENEIGKKSMKAYTFGLVCIICKFLRKGDKSNSALDLLNTMNTKTGLKYSKICQDITICIDSIEPILIYNFDPNTSKLLNHENSSELKKLFEIICGITFDK